MSIIADIKQKALDQSLLVPSAHERKYAKEHGLYVARLENGAKILSSQRIVSDSRLSTVSVNMNAGGYFDPKGYEGAHHFLEHLFFTQKLRTIYHNNLVEANAYTSQDRIMLYNKGGFNTNVKSFGLGAVLKDTFDSLIYPESLDSAQVFEYAKEIIIREIDEFFADYRRYLFDELYKLILEPENPFYESSLGTYESVKATTPEVVKEILNKNISTKNMIATIFAEGQGDEADELIKLTHALLEKFPRTHDVNEINPQLISKIKKLPSGKVVRHSVPIQATLVSMNYVWELPVEYLSMDDIVLRLLGPFLSELFSIEGREKGLGYSLYFYPKFFFPDKMLITASVLCPKEELERIADRTRQVIETLLQRPYSDESLFANLLINEKNRQMVEPIYSGARLSNSFDSLQWFDLLFNSEKLRQIYLSIQEKDVRAVHEKLMDKKPAVYILGNL